MITTKYATFAGMLAGLLSAGVYAAPPDAIQYLDLHATAFVQGADRVDVDPAVLEDKDYYTAQRFPQQAGVSLPDADLDAITKSILLLESQEPVLPRVRYLITYNLVSPPDYPDFHQELIEVIRFNMGPTLRKDIAAYVAAEHLAPAEAFGVGPHVSWRFALGPVMGMRAAVMQVSRTQLSEQQAAGTDCLGQSCLALEDPQGPPGEWNTPSLYGPMPEAVYISTQEDLAIPARVAQELLTYAVPDGVQVIPYQADKPRLVFVLSSNVIGQDNSSNGLVYDSNVMDHMIGASWTLRAQAAGMEQPQFRQQIIKRKP